MPAAPNTRPDGQGDETRVELKQQRAARRRPGQKTDLPVADPLVNGDDGALPSNWQDLAVHWRPTNRKDRERHLGGLGEETQETAEQAPRGNTCHARP
ncbi:hypothetical protein [Sinomonas humi]|uniref:hypothetical protein n=1 Tax=Sinomonas humi TaxID=1338436 RepID=UPI0012E0749C|nr:hypothetical protein [Sinomonas humi]